MRNPNFARALTRARKILDPLAQNPGSAPAKREGWHMWPPSCKFTK